MGNQDEDLLRSHEAEQSSPLAGAAFPADSRGHEQDPSRDASLGPGASIIWRAASADLDGERPSRFAAQRRG